MKHLPHLAVGIACSAAILAGCAGPNRTISAVPSRDASSDSASALTSLRAVTSERHGREIESGVPITVTDGHWQMIYPASAQVVRFDQGLAVTVNGRTIIYSPAAKVRQTGSYHHYAPVER